jgi:uncharacterized membrane protein
MKNLFVALCMLSLVTLTGCKPGTSGGPGATGTGAGNNVKQADNSFSLSVPKTSTTLKQGETKTIDIGIDRGKNFGEDVALKIGDLPNGVMVEPAAPVIKTGDKEAKLTVKAADDAALGDFNIKVTGHPAAGPDAVNDIKLKIEKK